MPKYLLIFVRYMKISMFDYIATCVEIYLDYLKKITKTNSGSAKEGYYPPNARSQPHIIAIPDVFEYILLGWSAKRQVSSIVVCTDGHSTEGMPVVMNGWSPVCIPVPMQAVLRVWMHPVPAAGMPAGPHARLHPSFTRSMLVGSQGRLHVCPYARSPACLPAEFGVYI